MNIDLQIDSDQLQKLQKFYLEQRDLFVYIYIYIYINHLSVIFIYRYSYQSYRTTLMANPIKIEPNNQSKPYTVSEYDTIKQNFLFVFYF